MSQIPAIGSFLGCRLHDKQTPARLKVVKRDISRVAEMADAAELAEAAADVTLAPEARLLAKRKCLAAFELCADERRNRPDVDLAKVKGSAVGLDSEESRHPWRYCSIFDWRRNDAVEREVPLVEIDEE